MPSALSIIGAVALIAIGAAGASAWDHHPAWSIDLPIPIIHPKFHIWPSLLEERDAALATAHQNLVNFNACNVAAFQASLASQARADLGEQALRQTRGELAELQAKAGRLHAAQTAAQAFVPVGSNACQRWESADDFVRRELLGLK